MEKLPRNARLESNGDLVFPQRGEAPRFPIQGYKKSKTDPWRYNAVFHPCIYRKLNETFYQKCGCMGVTTRCDFFNKTITLSKCLTCTEGKSPNDQVCDILHYEI